MPVKRFVVKGNESNKLLNCGMRKIGFDDGVN